MDLAAAAVANLAGHHDTMDVLTGFGVLLALALFAAAWIHTFSEWESTFRALVAPFEVRAPAPAPAPIIIV